ncbi:MAG: hypothetical protein ACE37E_13555 [Hyphomicrobiales bacterium]
MKQSAICQHMDAVLPRTSALPSTFPIDNTVRDASDISRFALAR